MRHFPALCLFYFLFFFYFFFKMQFVKWGNIQPGTPRQMLNYSWPCTIIYSWNCSEHRGTSTSPDLLSFSGCKSLRCSALCLRWLMGVAFASKTSYLAFCFRRVMKRFVTLINQLASASADTVAFQAQADAANKEAEKYMRDNELLKKVRWCHNSFGPGSRTVGLMRNCI